MWPIKQKEKRQLLLLWPNFIPYSKLQECVVTVLLSTSTPLLRVEAHSASTGGHLHQKPLIHEADPQSRPRPVVIIVFAHVVRPSPLFKTKQISSENNVH